MSKVFPGVAEVLANFRWLASMLMRLDFPTLERPMNAYSGKDVSGHLAMSVLLMMNSADLISMFVDFSWANIRFLIGFCIIF